MTIRVDSASLISGKTVVSLFAGNGILAQDIPSTGTSGAGYLYNDIAAQGAAPTDEMRGEILTWPSAGTLTVNEDSSFSFTGAPDGAYTFDYRGFLNGVTYGDFTVTIEIGWENTASTISYDIGEISFAVTAASSAPVIASEISYDIGQIEWAVNSSVIVAGNSASVAYDIGAIDFNVSASSSVPAVSATASYDIGEIVFAVSASATVPVPQDVSATIGYDIGAISFAVSARVISLNPMAGVGAGIQFKEPSRGAQF